ncbi:AAA family ATPase [Aeromonas dhakensis]|uniref:AAA family ATPase n=1 Tax=Aeromonas dhakensis TaxID=196024 RepID=UPI00039B9D45|nr:ATP-binding protein [Aeromonas dhakensis]
MSKIIVDKIFIEDFKRIKSQTIEVFPITAIVGGNASGKSSILQAAQLCTSIIQASFKYKKKGGNVDYYRTLANEDIVYRPTDKILDLKHSEPATQNNGFSIGYECTINSGEDGEKKSTLIVDIKRGKNANLSLTYKGDAEIISELGDKNNPFSIFTPGLSGIPIREEWRTRGALDSAAMHGDANLYLRTLLDHLFHKDLTSEEAELWINEKVTIDDLPKDSSWRLFSQFLDECYPGLRLYVLHNKESERYINITLYYQDNYFTIDMASMGMLQVIQILAYACFYRPPLLLLDEPDAHLHADSQTRLNTALKMLAKKTDTKIILATHSPQLIQLLQDDDDSKIIWLNSGAEVPIVRGQKPTLPLLMELGALTVASDVFSTKYKLILLTEDKDTSFVKAFAKANSKKNMCIISYNGCNNLQGARQLAILLTNIRPDIKVVIHRDRDFRNESEMNFERLLFEQFLKNEDAERIVELFTPLNDIEHSFLSTKHLSHIFTDREEIIDQALKDAAEVKRDELICKIRDARNVIKERLYDSKRMAKKTHLREQSGINETPPQLKTFIPKDGKTPLSIEQCHGKTLYKAFLSEVHRVAGGNTKEITKQILETSPHLKNKDWEKALTI